MKAKEVIEKIKRESVYSLAANHYHKLDKSTLVDILKELDFAISEEVSEFKCQDINNKLLESLEEVWEEEIKENVDL